MGEKEKGRKGEGERVKAHGFEIQDYLSIIRSRRLTWSERSVGGTSF